MNFTDWEVFVCDDVVFVTFDKCKKNNLHLSAMFRDDGKVLIEYNAVISKFCNDIQLYEGVDKSEYIKKTRELIENNKDTIEQKCNGEIQFCII